MTGSLKGILSEIFPSEPEDGDKDGNNGDRLIESPAPGIDDQILQQGAVRPDLIGDDEKRCADKADCLYE